MKTNRPTAPAALKVAAAFRRRLHTILATGFAAAIIMSASPPAYAQEAAPPALSMEGAILSGMAEFIADRMKSEFVAWFMDEITRDVCFDSEEEKGIASEWAGKKVENLGDLGSEPKTKERFDKYLLFKEYRTQKFVEAIQKSNKSQREEFFPNFCNFQRIFQTSPLTSYPALVTAVREDLQGLPAVLISKAIAPSGGAPVWPKVIMQMLQEMRRARTPADALRVLSSKPANVMGLSLDQLENAYDNSVKSRCTTISPDCALLFAGTLADSYSSQTNARGVVDMIKVFNDAKTKIFARFNITISDEFKIEFINARINRMRAVYSRMNSLSRETKLSRDEQAEQLRDAAYDLGLELVGTIEDVCGLVKSVGKECNFGFSGLKDGWKAIRSFSVAAAAFNAGKVQQGLVALTGLISQSDDLKINPVVTKYMTFMISLAQVRNSEDAKDLISSIASPVGAWRMKRTKTMFSFAALGGGYIGNSGSNVPGQDVGPISGVFAPVGFDLSFPIPAQSWTWGFFFSALDLGGFVGTYFEEKSPSTTNSDTVKTPSSATLDQVFAPGVFFRIGLGRTPLVFGLGYQYAPKMLVVSSTDPTLNNRPVATDRRIIFLAFDIPILPLW